MTNWVAPKNWTDGPPPVTASDLNTELKNQLLHLKEQSERSSIRLFSDSSAVANGTTVETTLASYTLPAADAANYVGLYEDEQRLRIECDGQFANNANTKTWKIYFGTKVITLAAVTTAGIDAWRIDARVKRTGLATQKLYVRISIAVGTGTDRQFYDTATESLASSVLIKITGQSSVAGGDITKQDFVVYRE